MNPTELIKLLDRNPRIIALSLFGCLVVGGIGGGLLLAVRQEKVDTYESRLSRLEDAQKVFQAQLEHLKLGFEAHEVLDRSHLTELEQLLKQEGLPEIAHGVLTRTGSGLRQGTRELREVLIRVDALGSTLGELFRISSLTAEEFDIPPELEPRAGEDAAQEHPIEVVHLASHSLLDPEIRFRLLVDTSRSRLLADRWLSRAAIELRELGSTEGEAYAISRQASLALSAADYSRARELFQEALAVRGEVEDERSALLFMNLARAHAGSGSQAEARLLFERSLSLLSAFAPDSAVRERALIDYAIQRLGDDDEEAALRLLREVIEIREERRIDLSSEKQRGGSQ